MALTGKISSYERSYRGSAAICRWTSPSTCTLHALPLCMQYTAFSPWKISFFFRVYCSWYCNTQRTNEYPCRICRGSWLAWRVLYSSWRVLCWMAADLKFANLKVTHKVTHCYSHWKVEPFPFPSWCAGAEKKGGKLRIFAGKNYEFSMVKITNFRW